MLLIKFQEYFEKMYSCSGAFRQFIHFAKICWDQVYSYTRVSIQVNTSQHESTRVNTNQHESNLSQHESTRVRHESIRINTSPKQVLDKIFITF